MTMRTVGALFLAAVIGPGLAWAQHRVDEQRPAAPDARVHIENLGGSIRVIGWDREEVAVKGTLGSGADGLDFSGGPNRIQIEGDYEHPPHGGNADLEIFVPQGAEVEVEGFSANINVAKVTGQVAASTVNGDITVACDAREIRIETVNGSLDITGKAARVEAESVNGSVKVRGSSGEVEASTVNGELLVDGGTFKRASLGTVNGSIRFVGNLAASASLDIESVGGDVRLVLPADVSADFTIATFSGEIVNDLGPAAEKISRYTSEKELRFSTGSGGARVSVETLSGTVKLEKQ